ncbi:motile sperm domain-containing protein 2-like [Limulus polyphemus]|uniref:Motile sperm domain-containing protein 2-like n=1 Tax=Limulus polyphemus TaxID=6850 RepID=A0ABM1SH08_LIMPO|nr:motile sperm domain-containing protein 2-like [Limulus polyphemus]
MSPQNDVNHTSSLLDDTSINMELVTEVRKRVLEQLDLPDWKDNYDQRDIERLMQDNWYCARFIKHQRDDIENSLNMIREALKWRKEMEIHDLGEHNLYAEYFSLGATFPYNCDKAGFRILVMRVKLHTKNAATMLEQKKFVAYWIEKLDHETNGGKISILMDFSDSGFSNMDMELTFYIVSLFKYYFPFALGYVYVYEMPWLFNACWKIIKNLLPEEATVRFKFINKSSIGEYIAVDQLPIHLGGSCPRDYAILQSNDKGKKLSSITNVYPRKKKVYFAKENEIYESDKNYNIEKKFTSNDQNILLSPHSSSGDIQSLGSLLKMCPGLAIVFPETSDSEATYVCLTLTSITSNCVAYKLKTNNLGNYHVHPSFGVIKPGEYIIVHIQLTPGSRCGTTDKLLLLAVEIEDEDAKGLQINKLWENNYPEKILKHKFRCVHPVSMLGDVVNKSLGTTSIHTQTDHLPHKILEDKIESMQKEMLQLQKQNDTLQKCQKIVIILLLLLVFLQMIVIVSQQFYSWESRDHPDLSSSPFEINN